MSTPSGSGPAEAKNADRRMSLGKYVKRMSSVFKREKSSKSGEGVTAIAPAVSQEEQAQPTKDESAKEEVAPAT